MLADCRHRAIVPRGAALLGRRRIGYRPARRADGDAAQMWVAGELESPKVESWHSFCARVDRGIAQIRRDALKNGNIVVFTSGGVIAATARAALDLSPQKTLELSWTPRNAGYSEFLFSGERFSLSTFNNLPHLEDAELLTYR